jgi:hypothetical protein
MSWLPSISPEADGAVDLVIEPNSQDLGGFSASGSFLKKRTKKLL